MPLLLLLLVKLFCNGKTHHKCTSASSWSCHKCTCKSWCSVATECVFAFFLPGCLLLKVSLSAAWSIASHKMLLVNASSIAFSQCMVLVYTTKCQRMPPVYGASVPVSSVQCPVCQCQVPVCQVPVCQCASVPVCSVPVCSASVWCQCPV